MSKKLKSETKEEKSTHLYIPLDTLIQRIKEHEEKAGIFGLRVLFPTQKAKANALLQLLADFGNNKTNLNEIILGKKHAELEAVSRRLQSK